MNALLFNIGKTLLYWKVVGYGLLCFFLYSDFIGPEKLAQLLLNGKEINEVGKEHGALMISTSLIRITIMVALFELLSNIVQALQVPKKCKCLGNCESIEK